MQRKKAHWYNSSLRVILRQGLIAVYLPPLLDLPLMEGYQTLTECAFLTH